MTRHLTLSVAVISFLLGSCSRQEKHKVDVREDENAFYLSFPVPELKDRCYAPTHTLLNGNLGLPEIVGANRWRVVRGEPVPTDDLNWLLSGKRQKIGAAVRMTIPRYAISMSPFYLVISTFPCDAPTRAKGWKPDTVDIVASADLPLPFPPGYREPGAGDPNDMDDMMLNSGEIANSSSDRR